MSKKQVDQLANLTQSALEGKAAAESALARAVRERDEARAEATRWRDDAALLDYLQEEVVDTIYLDDGKIIDVRGGSVRKAIQADRQARGPRP